MNALILKIMGKTNGGIHGKTSGKVGNLVYYNSGEKQLVRTAPAAPTKFTEGQLSNQNGFGSKQQWLTPISSFLKVGCKNTIPYVGGSGLALSYMCANAVEGKGKDSVILPEKVRVSIGDLPASATASVTLEGQELVFSWDTALSFPASAFDSVLVLAYDPQQGFAESFIKGYFRKDGSLRMSIPKAGNYHCYLGFVAEDRSRQSNSQYLGQLEVI